MSTHQSFTIIGRTTTGQLFRPSDWPERLCGVMACFSPYPGLSESHLYYSSYVYPTSVDNIKAVFVHAAIADIEPAAYRFLRDFARDNASEVLINDTPPST